MNWRAKWQKIGRRDWIEVRDAWIAVTPDFPDVGARPDPGLEDLQPLLGISISNDRVRHQDVAGLRANALWESLFLFHKCSHTLLASQRLGLSGMHSWCLFNAYHSAFLGARGLMALLGVSFPRLNGDQVMIDLYPPGEKPRNHKILAWHPFDEFLAIRLQKFEHRQLWEAFQRVLKMSSVSLWDDAISHELISLKHGDIAPSRNRFLYRNNFWPLDDLICDGTPEEFEGLCDDDLDADGGGFLLSLSFEIYRLFECLIKDLSLYSVPIQEQYEGSRCFDRDHADLRLLARS